MENQTHGRNSEDTLRRDERKNNPDDVIIFGSEATQLTESLPDTPGRWTYFTMTPKGCIVGNGAITTF